MCEHPRELDSFDTKCQPLLECFESRLDIIYDPPHCVALVLSHGVCHSLYLWTTANEGDTYVVLLSAILQRHTKLHPYYPPENETIGRKDWKMTNNLAKDLLANNLFWLDLQNMFPTKEQGLNVGATLDDGLPPTKPIQEFLLLVRNLARQILAWDPQDVDKRDVWSARVHNLNFALGLPQARFSVAMHYFLEHYTERLERHGNLQGSCSEGGEPVHQPHAQIVHRRPSRPRYKCPEGLLACIKAAALQLALWRQAWVLTVKWFFQGKVRLPPNQ